MDRQSQEPRVIGSDLADPVSMTHTGRSIGGGLFFVGREPVAYCGLLAGRGRLHRLQEGVILARRLALAGPRRGSVLTGQLNGCPLLVAGLPGWGGRSATEPIVRPL